MKAWAIFMVFVVVAFSGCLRSSDGKSAQSSGQGSGESADGPTQAGDDPATGQAMCRSVNGFEYPCDGVNCVSRVNDVQWDCHEELVDVTLLDEAFSLDLVTPSASFDVQVPEHALLGSASVHFDQAAMKAFQIQGVCVNALSSSGTSVQVNGEGPWIQHEDVAVGQGGNMSARCATEAGPKTLSLSATGLAEGKVLMVVTIVRLR